MKFVSTEEDTVGHIPQHLSEVCFRFVEKMVIGGQIDAEVIGKRFNSGDGLGVQVPVELSFVGNKKYLKNLRRRLCPAIQAEHTRKPNLKLKLPSDIELKASD